MIHRSKIVPPWLCAGLPLLLVAFPAAADETPICTDRPTKANAVCTVPAGELQIETDAVNWTTNRAGGARIDVILYTNPTLKLGLGHSTDVEISLPPLVESRTRTGAGVYVARGSGDLLLRVKQRVTRAGAQAQLGLIPFVKVPTARRIGNGRWEGGIAIPVQFTLSRRTTLTFGPEIDILADGDGHGRHVQIVTLVNMSRTLSPRLTTYVELWTAQNFDPTGTVRQYSIDGAVSYWLSPTLQLDVGLNIGLNRATPDAQVYGGISARF
jgi:hypothetical protein